MIDREKRSTHLKLLAGKIVPHKKHTLILFVSIGFSLSALSIALATSTPNKTGSGVLGATISNAPMITVISPVVEVPTQIPPTMTPTLQPTPPPKYGSARISPTHTPNHTPTPVVTNPKYTAEKINDTTWKVKDVENDNSMASSQDVVNAINNYRNAHGLANLSSDGYLNSFAQDRANLFSSNGSLDSHAGFQAFMSNDGFNKAGFNSLGENSAMLSGPMGADKIVKNIFGADPSHDGNQLDNWTHVGVGIAGNAVNVNFGKGKK